MTKNIIILLSIIIFSISCSNNKITNPIVNTENNDVLTLTENNNVLTLKDYSGNYSGYLKESVTIKDKEITPKLFLCSIIIDGDGNIYSDKLFDKDTISASIFEKISEDTFRGIYKHTYLDEYYTINLKFDKSINTVLVDIVKNVHIPLESKFSYLGLLEKTDNMH